MGSREVKELSLFPTKGDVRRSFASKINLLFFLMVESQKPYLDFDFAFEYNI